MYVLDLLTPSQRDLLCLLCPRSNPAHEDVELRYHQIDDLDLLIHHKLVVAKTHGRGWTTTPKGDKLVLLWMEE